MALPQIFDTSVLTRSARVRDPGAVNSTRKFRCIKFKRQKTLDSLIQSSRPFACRQNSCRQTGNHGNRNQQTEADASTNRYGDISEKAVLIVAQ